MTESQTQFVHLNLHTEHSLVDSIIRLPTLSQRLLDLKMPAVAMTDSVNLFAAVKFYNKLSGAGIKPLIGADVVVEEKGKRYVLTLLCQNSEGYKNLCQLISRAYLEGQDKGVPLVQSKWVWEKSQGLIAISGTQYGLYNTELKKGKNKFTRIAALVESI